MTAVARQYRPRVDWAPALTGLTALAAFLLAVALLALDAGAQATRPAALVSAVARVGVVVEDMDRSVAFYAGALDFEVVADDEVAGAALEQLTGVFGARCRVVRMQLGDEEIELTEYLAAEARGRPVPRDS